MLTGSRNCLQEFAPVNGTLHLLNLATLTRPRTCIYVNVTLTHDRSLDLHVKTVPRCVNKAPMCEGELNL